MKILILGGAGFLGSNFVRRCLKDSNDVTVIDSLDERLRSTKNSLEEVMPRITFLHEDIRQAHVMSEAVKGFDAIVNCAGQTSHSQSLEDPLFDVELNCKAPLTVLEAVRKHNPQAKVIFPSTSTVIGRSDGHTIDDNEIEAPLEIYSANKAVAEKYHQIYHAIHGINTVCLRFANLYGPHGKGFSEFGFINYFISLAQAGKDITVFGDGKQKRNVMYVEDACEFLYRALTCDDLIGGVYWAVHRDHHSVMDIATTIQEVFQKGKVKKHEWPDLRKRIEINDMIISGKKLYEKLQFEPKWTLREGLKRTREIIDQQRVAS